MKTLVTSFGRMNPVTAGHAKLIDKIISTAKKNKADHALFVSQSQDAKKNPLSYKDKVGFIRKIYPKSNVQMNKSVKTLFDIITYAADRGYEKIIIVVGSDRLPEIERLKKYSADAGIEIEAVSAGDRDPDSDGVTGISASKMRAFAQNDDFKSFMKGLPRGVSSRLGQELFDVVKKGMGLSEAYEMDGVYVPMFGTIEREELPQVDYWGMVKDLQASDVYITRETVPPSSLIPTQKEFNIEKTRALMKTLKDSMVTPPPTITLGLDVPPPILVSSDRYIIDGHHRWLAAFNTNPKIEISILPMTYDEFIEYSKGKSWVKYKTIEESVSSVWKKLTKNIRVKNFSEADIKKMESAVIALKKQVKRRGLTGSYSDRTLSKPLDVVKAAYKKAEMTGDRRVLETAIKEFWEFIDETSHEVTSFDIDDDAYHKEIFGKR